MERLDNRLLLHDSIYDVISKFKLCRTIPLPGFTKSIVAPFVTNVVNQHDHSASFGGLFVRLSNFQLTKHCRVCGGRLVVAKKSKRTIYNSLSYKKELKLAFGIDVIVDHIEIHPPSFCKPCKLSMDRVLNASRQNKLVPFRSLVTPYKWKAHTADKCGVCQHFEVLMKGGLDVALQNIGVERQQYFGGTFVGNHIHKTLKPTNLKLLC
ncbi:hypothetical protein EMCRGX_G019462 [Ephydatia muelleri]